MAFNKIELNKLTIPSETKISEICLQEQVLREFAASIAADTTTMDIPSVPNDIPVIPDVNAFEPVFKPVNDSPFGGLNVEATTDLPPIDTMSGAMDISPVFEPLVDEKSVTNEEVNTPVTDGISEDEIIAAVKPVFDILDDKIKSGTELSSNLTVLYSALLFVNSKKNQVEHNFTK